MDITNLTSDTDTLGAGDEKIWEDLKTLKEDLKTLKEDFKALKEERQEVFRKNPWLFSLQKYTQLLKLGQAELKKREIARQKRQYHRLLNSSIFESDGITPVRWVRGVLKKGFFYGTPVVVIPRDKTKPIVQGRRGRRCYALRIAVGAIWLVNNKRQLAKKYIKTHKR
jgi:hypothetical protein